MNWRLAQLAPISYWMPCRPDELRREVRLGEVAVTVDLRQCEAGGTRWALSRWTIPQGTSPEHVMAWSLAQWPQSQPWAPTPDAVSWRAPVRLHTLQGESAPLRWYRMTWVEAGQVWEATALKDPDDPRALAGFFGGLGGGALPVSAAPPHNSGHV